jgi:predicted transcriptional regulator
MKMTWEWIAGFFEGEGNVFWQEGKNGTKQGLVGRATIGQKDKRALQSIYNFLLEKGFSPPQFYLRPAANTPHSSSIWILAIGRRDDVIRFYSEISPYLFEKKSEAEYVINRLESQRDARNEILKRAFDLKEKGLSWRSISRELGIGRIAISNYVKSAGLSFSETTHFEDRKEWRQDRVDRGLCEDCGEKRGDDGIKRKCKKCKDRYNLSRREQRKRLGMEKPE